MIFTGCLVLDIVGLFRQCLEAERYELLAVTAKEFVLKFHPMKTQSVQRSAQGLHNHEDAECAHAPGSECAERADDPLPARRAYKLVEHLVQEDFAELGVCEAEGPQACSE